MTNFNTVFYKGRDLSEEHRQIIQKMNRHFNWTPKMSQADFRMNISHYLVLTDKDKLIGYIGLHYIIDEFEINTVYLDPTYRGQGLGRYLMNALFETATKEANILNDRPLKTILFFDWRNSHTKDISAFDDGENYLFLSKDRESPMNKLWVRKEDVLYKYGLVDEGCTHCCGANLRVYITDIAFVFCNCASHCCSSSTH